ncbi:MAG: hypothetical protein CVV64_10490 [Candidatus Wallbacteria bacterium HGW-Wallbacteria-1]|jgi:hypothetical protein|uniref:FecR protein domain-containing protein n=1 Tax=Candidatus Wallbacteria bacterium HGW-Wallbacteria-1 TaxID=2013854 RepID=A0A2N1PP76_9BACT|nr:MAG: hypothetical protein CVV64_10490 [Candidatus Wallbacteria bacterium HGW-Wallbacteria-1]
MADRKSVAALLLLVSVFVVSSFYASNANIEEERFATVKVLEGTVSLKDEGMRLEVDKPGREFPVTVGYTISVGEGSKGLLNYSDGTRLQLASSTELKIVLGGIKIKKGRTWMYFVKQKQKFVIQSPSAIMGVLGTTLKVDVTERATDLTVFDGRVSIKAGQNEKIVSGGGKAIASDGKIVESNALESDLKAWSGIRKNLVPAEKIQGTPTIPGLGMIPEKNGTSEKVAVKLPSQPFETAEESVAAVEVSDSKAKSTMLGDLDDDFKRSSADVELIRMHVYENRPLDSRRSALADVDGNGKVTAEDMRILEYKVSGIGDFDGDGTVDDADLSLIQDAVEYNGEVSKYDVNRDGKVNKGDLFLFRTIRKSLSKFTD